MNEQFNTFLSRARAGLQKIANDVNAVDDDTDLNAGEIVTLITNLQSIYDRIVTPGDDKILTGGDITADLSGGSAPAEGSVVDASVVWQMNQELQALLAALANHDLDADPNDYIANLTQVMDWATNNASLLEAMAPATASSPGFMSSAQASKLANIEANAKNTPLSADVESNDSAIAASTSITYALKALIDALSTNKSDTGHRHGNATPGSDGFMSKEDKEYIDLLPEDITALQNRLSGSRHIGTPGLVASGRWFNGDAGEPTNLGYKDIHLSEDGMEVLLRGNDHDSFTIIKYDDEGKVSDESSFSITNIIATDSVTFAHLNNTYDMGISRDLNLLAFRCSDPDQLSRTGTSNGVVIGLITRFNPESNLFMFSKLIIPDEITDNSDTMAFFGNPSISGDGKTVVCPFYDRDTLTATIGLVYRKNGQTWEYYGRLNYGAIPSTGVFSRINYDGTVIAIGDSRKTVSSKSYAGEIHIFRDDSGFTYTGSIQSPYPRTSGYFGSLSGRPFDISDDGNIIAASDPASSLHTEATGRGIVATYRFDGNDYLLDQVLYNEKLTNGNSSQGSFGGSVNFPYGTHDLWISDNSSYLNFDGETITMPVLHIYKEVEGELRYFSDIKQGDLSYINVSPEPSYSSNNNFGSRILVSGKYAAVFISRGSSPILLRYETDTDWDPYVREVGLSDDYSTNLDDSPGFMRFRAIKRMVERYRGATDDEAFQIGKNKSRSEINRNYEIVSLGQSNGLMGNLLNKKHHIELDYRNDVGDLRYGRLVPILGGTSVVGVSPVINDGTAEEENTVLIKFDYDEGTNSFTKSETRVLSDIVGVSQGNLFLRASTDDLSYIVTSNSSGSRLHVHYWNGSEYIYIENFSCSAWATPVFRGSTLYYSTNAPTTGAGVFSAATNGTDPLVHTEVYGYTDNALPYIGSFFSMSADGNILGVSYGTTAITGGNISTVTGIIILDLSGDEPVVIQTLTSADTDYYQTSDGFGLRFAFSENGSKLVVARTEEYDTQPRLNTFELTEGSYVQVDSIVAPYLGDESGRSEWYGFQLGMTGDGNAVIAAGNETTYIHVRKDANSKFNKVFQIKTHNTVDNFVAVRHDSIVYKEDVGLRTYLTSVGGGKYGLYPPTLEDSSSLVDPYEDNINLTSRLDIRKEAIDISATGATEGYYVVSSEINAPRINSLYYKANSAEMVNLSLTVTDPVAATVDLHRVEDGNFYRTITVPSPNVTGGDIIDNDTLVFVTDGSVDNLHIYTYSTDSFETFTVYGSPVDCCYGHYIWILVSSGRIVSWNKDRKEQVKLIEVSTPDARIAANGRSIYLFAKFNAEGSGEVYDEKSGILQFQSDEYKTVLGTEFSHVYLDESKFKFILPDNTVRSIHANDVASKKEVQFLMENALLSEKEQGILDSLNSDLEKENYFDVGTPSAASSLTGTSPWVESEVVPFTPGLIYDPANYSRSYGTTLHESLSGDWSIEWDLDLDLTEDYMLALMVTSLGEVVSTIVVNTQSGVGSTPELSYIPDQGPAFPVAGTPELIWGDPLDDSVLVGVEWIDQNNFTIMIGRPTGAFVTRNVTLGTPNGLRDLGIQLVVVTNNIS